MVNKLNLYLKLNEEITFDVNTKPDDLIEVSHTKYKFKIDNQIIDVKFLLETFNGKDEFIYAYEREYQINGSMSRQNGINWRKILSGISYITKKFISDNNLDILVIKHIRTSTDPDIINRRAELNKFYLNVIASDLNLKLIQFKNNNGYNTTYSILYSEGKKDIVQEIMDDLIFD